MTGLDLHTVYCIILNPRFRSVTLCHLGSFIENWKEGKQKKKVHKKRSGGGRKSLSPDFSNTGKRQYTLRTTQNLDILTNHPAWDRKSNTVRVKMSSGKYLRVPSTSRMGRYDFLYSTSKQTGPIQYTDNCGSIIFIFKLFEYCLFSRFVYIRAICKRSKSVGTKGGPMQVARPLLTGTLTGKWHWQVTPIGYLCLYCVNFQNFLYSKKS